LNKKPLKTDLATNTVIPVAPTKGIEKHRNRVLPRFICIWFVRVPAGVRLSYDGFTNEGEKVNGHSKWFLPTKGILFGVEE
jgi:hypothetical protein